MAAHEVGKYVSALGELVAEKKITYRGLDSLLGWKPGSTRRLLRAERQLRLGQLLEILHGLGVEPLEFYVRVHPKSPVLDRLVSALQTADPPPPLILPSHLEPGELSRLIRQAVEQALEARESNEP